MDPYYQDPEETYRAYDKCLRKQEFLKAYRCLERLLKEFPHDQSLLQEIIALCLGRMNNPALARPWVMKRIRLAPSWDDYALLSEIEAKTGQIAKAKEYLELAGKLQKKQQGARHCGGDAKTILSHARDILKLEEYTRWVKGAGLFVGTGKVKGSGKIEQKSVPAPRSSTKKEGISPAAKEVPPPASLSQETAPATYSIPVRVEPVDPAAAAGMCQARSTLKECRLRIEYASLDVQSGFDELLCLGAIKGIEHYWYQVETVKKVLKYFHGRVLLADEVGLGKTIEAGMLIKEYLLRGMVQNILILTPAPLVSQWREEMEQKFAIPFITTDDPLFHTDPEQFWKRRFIIASIHTAKGSKHVTRVVNEFYDLVVVDEAHHLKNRHTLVWKLVNEIKKRFIFLLTATPVQNDLIELFNLITLLKPGQFKTEKLFKKEYMERGDPRTPANKERLRELLRDVMIRNTRSAIDLKLPRRYAATLRLEPTEAERRIYEGITSLARKRSDALPKPLLQLLMREAGSSPHALQQTLLALRSKVGGAADPILEVIAGLGETSKERALLDLLRKNPEEKKILFAHYFKSLDLIASLLDQHGFLFVTFRGDMTAREKDEAIRRFRDAVPILLSTESGGEGRNLQFCHTLINFDLPWNPMRIEQRIGRLHRIGQTRDVFIFNLSVKETLEDHLLEILEGKINMFEMVIGEIEPILGYLEDDKEFEEIVMAIWLKSRNPEEARSGFETLGQDMAKAKAAYLESKELDRVIFGEEYEV